MGLRTHHTYGQQADRLLSAEVWDNGTRPSPSGNLSVALIYPNAYQFGMANLGFLTVHRLAATVPGIGVERFFSALATDKVLTPPFYSLETRRPLGDFPVLAWSFSFEGDFAAIPAILGPLGIPVRRSERAGSAKFPLLIAGGAAVTANPASLSEIFDILAPGEAEGIWPPLLRNLLEHGPYASSVADLPGVWVPGLRDTINPAPQAHDVAVAPAFSHVVTPHQIFPNAPLLEIMRGCPRACRFCLARVIYAPSRPVPVATITAWLQQRLDRREIGLVAPSLFDHPQLAELLQLLATQQRRLFNSSVKWEQLDHNILQLLRQCGVKSLTLAPESGSARLRTLMGKALRVEAFFATLAAIAVYGFDQVKLYFIFGLPQETEEDLEDSVAFLERVAQTVNKHKFTVTAAFSPFVPKPGTPWAQQEFAGYDKLKAATRVLKRGLQPLRKSIKADFAGLRASVRQAYLAQAGPELADELHEEAIAWRNGKSNNLEEIERRSFLHF